MKESWQYFMREMQIDVDCLVKGQAMVVVVVIVVAGQQLLKEMGFTLTVQQEKKVLQYYCC